MQISCEGEVVTGISGEPMCQDMLGAPLAWTVEQDFDIAMIDTETAGSAFAAGFVLVGIGWAIGRGVKYVLDMLK